jgi:hypothetical protein
MESGISQQQASGQRAETENRKSQTPPPPFRRLRGYAFDPSLSIRLDTALINETVFEIPWDEKLLPGPIDKYIEVVDYDPASRCWYDPVNLNEPELLGQDGLPPSAGNPQFHQQMAYAVSRNTIKHFERALGRWIFWAPEEMPNSPSTPAPSPSNPTPNPSSAPATKFVQRLRLYPHAIRAANAYYSPQKKSILFGYFPSSAGTVFTCLSHDIVAHETTHALLDGMHRRYIEDNHEDTLAFHEAFADLVALFQHFTFSEVLQHQIARTRGDLATQSLLGELAQQFGEATGQYGALRSAIGRRNRSGKWEPILPDPALLAHTREPHARGAILVAAVFRAFLSIYRSRVADLIRLATAGSGELPAGAIHPDLVSRLAAEAAKTAQHFLSICIRALDYCPPVDVTFGDYLRALVTADFDMVPNDRHGYRIALIESFRQWGIVLEDVRTHSEEHLRWPFAHLYGNQIWEELNKPFQTLRQLVGDSLYFEDRQMAFNRLRDAQKVLHDDLHALLSDATDENLRHQFERITGLVVSESSGLVGLKDDRYGIPYFEVHAIRPALRVRPEGEILKQVIITITQRRKVPLKESDPNGPTMIFRGGCTLILDLKTLFVRYAIARRIDNNDRLNRIRTYRTQKAEEDFSARATYFGNALLDASSESANAQQEPFALLHSEE